MFWPSEALQKVTEQVDFKWTKVYSKKNKSSTANSFSKPTYNHRLGFHLPRLLGNATLSQAVLTYYPAEVNSRLL